MSETIKVKHPFSEQILELPFPSVALFGTEEDCVILLLTSGDPAECGAFRGDLTKDPELREELFGGDRPLIHWDEQNSKPVTMN